MMQELLHYLTINKDYTFQELPKETSMEKVALMQIETTSLPGTIPMAIN